MMKKFLIKTSFFCLLSTILILVLILPTNRMIRKKARFTLPADISMIIMGHSHPALAYNDSLIDHFKNCASTAEAYLYSYLKLKELLQQNQQIQTVFVEFSNGQISATSMNNWIWGNEHITRRFKMYAPFMGKQENELLFEKNTIGYLSSLSLLLKSNLEVINYQEYNFIKKTGGYLYRDRENIDSLLQVRETKPPNTPAFQFSEYNIFYLKKIVAECSNRNVRLFLIRTPLHKAYSGFQNEKYFREIMHSQFSAVEFLDFYHFPLANDEFADFEHLNYKGARKYSQFFDGLIKKGLLDSLHKQDFIDTEILKIDSSAINRLRDNQQNDSAAEKIARHHFLPIPSFRSTQIF